MHNEIKHLRKKFCILSASISFAVIFIMLIILNLLMNISFSNELKAATDIISQTAISNVPDIDSEIIMLKNTKTDQNGNHIIERNPRTIKSITINGNISCKNDTAEWYCAGGGIYFEFPDNSEDFRFIHKEYKFNQGNTKILVDFNDDSNFMYNKKPFKADIMHVSEKCFYISPVWWSMASTSYNDHNPDVTLTIDSIEIQYHSNSSAVLNKNYMFKIRNFSDIYPSEIPYTLNNFRFFYYITDKQDNPVELNSGNTELDLTDKELINIIKESKYNNINFKNTSYKHFLTETDEFKTHIFIDNTVINKNSRQLFMMSVISGSAVLLLVFVLIYFVSGKAIIPIKESYKKQNEFISNASHELKTPITVISATTQLMEKKMGSDRLLSCIQVQSQKMSRLVNEMLALTRISNSGKQLNAFNQFDMSKTVINNILYFESRAFEEGKQIKTDIQEGIVFTGNQNKIDELIGILLDNALKYSDEKSVIKFELHSEKGNIVLSCENKCENFDENNIPHLFDRFYRGDKSHSTMCEGFGLGLAIANEIVSIHKGKINVEYKDSSVIFKVLL